MEYQERQERILVEIVVEDLSANGSPFYCYGWQTGECIGTRMTPELLYSRLSLARKFDPNLFDKVLEGMPSSTFNPRLLERRLSEIGLVKSFERHQLVEGTGTTN